LLPAGIVITGGGAGIINIEDLAKATLKLPSKIAKITTNLDHFTNTTNGGGVKIKDATWAVSYGLCVFGLHADDGGNIAMGLGKTLFRKIRRGLVNWFKKFLP
jgi:cell division ATPase FtsA